jgi:hypothetical protein
MYNEQEITAIFASTPNSPVISVKKNPVPILSGHFFEEQAVSLRKVELTDTRIFAFPRSLEKLVNLIDLRLDYNCLSYVCYFRSPSSDPLDLSSASPSLLSSLSLTLPGPPSLSFARSLTVARSPSA